MPGSEGGSAGAAWVLGDAETVRGFRLGGYAGRVVATAEDAREVLATLRAEGAALVVMTERVCEMLGGLIGLAGGPLRPLVAVIPAVTPPRADPRPAEALSRIVRRALGLPPDAQSAPR
jgi:vacuolar-type H+-ATPase subunit F/Vma7